MDQSGNYLAKGDFILSLIPQKDPFVMVDGITEYTDRLLVSTYTIKENNILVSQGRLTEAGLIENMAQTVALHTGYKYYLMGRPAPTGYIGAIKNAKIMELPKTSQKLATTVRILHDIMDITMVRTEILCEETPIAFSEMKTALAQ